MSQLILPGPKSLLIPVDLFQPKGLFIAEHWRKGLLIDRQKFPNGITNIGKDTILNVMFNSLTQIAQASWCIGQIDNASFTALAAADTMASHAGWVEFTGYSEANRVAWGPGNSSGQTVTNATAATFDITSSSATLQGVFVTSQNTIGGTTGTLWTTALYSSPIPVTNGDQIKISYSISC